MCFRRGFGSGSRSGSKAFWGISGGLVLQCPQPLKFRGVLRGFTGCHVSFREFQGVSRRFMRFQRGLRDVTGAGDLQGIPNWFQWSFGGVSRCFNASHGVSKCYGGFKGILGGFTKSQVSYRKL